MISRDELKEMLRYDTNHEHFVCLYNINKTLRKGSVVRGSRPNDHAPLTVSLNGTTYPLHRLVWLWYRGEFNKKPLYHINGDKTDNRYSNLTLMQKGTKLEYNQDTGYVSGVQQKTEQKP